MVSKITKLVKQYEADIILAIAVVLISLISFAIGYLAAREQFKESIRVETSSEY
jgi:hypothetical protein